MLFSLFSSSSVAAQSLSDLNLEGFDKITKTIESRPVSDPFSGQAGLALDLTLEDLQLTGTLLGKNTYALINGFLVKAGDVIAGFKVDRISHGRVVLKRLEETYILTLGGEL